MKQKIFSVINFIIISIIITSCNNEDLNVTYEKYDTNNTIKRQVLNKDIEVIYFDGEPTLKFKNESGLTCLVNKLKTMTSNEQMSFLQNIGIRTFYSEFYSIDKLLKEDLFICKNKDEFIKKYEYIKNLKSKYALFPDINKTTNGVDVYPELRAKSIIESNIANKNGYYIVKDSLHKIELFDNIDDLKKSITLIDANFKSNSLRSNNAFAKTNNRKARIEMRFDPIHDVIMFRFSAQMKLGWLITWWGRCSTKIYGFITIDKLSHRIKVLNSTKYEYITLRENGGTKKIPAPFYIENLMTKNTLELYTKELETEYIPFAEIIQPSNIHYENFNDNFKMIGNMEVWSRGIPYNKAGRDSINIEIKKHL